MEGGGGRFARERGKKKREKKTKKEKINKD